MPKNSKNFGNETGDRDTSLWALRYLSWLIVAGAFFIVILVGADHFTLVSLVSGLLVAGAFLLGGGLLGFLFGIPRSLAQDSIRLPSPEEGVAESEAGKSISTATRGGDLGRGGGYAANTNLEQISDWLTKIIVGVGLVQLYKVPGLLFRLTEFLKLGSDTSQGAALEVGVVFYFSISGFLVGYLWTRLFLAAEFSKADILARGIDRRIGRIEESASRRHEAIQALSEAWNSMGRRTQVVSPTEKLSIPVGMSQLAEFKINRALQLDPDLAAAYKYKGLLHYSRGELTQAIEATLEALKRDPDDPTLLNNLGNIYYLMGDRDRSIDYYRRAIAAFPRFAEALKNLGNTLLEIKKADEAVETLRMASEIDDSASVKVDLAKALLARGIELRVAGKTEEAEVAIAEANQLSDASTSSARDGN